LDGVGTILATGGTLQMAFSTFEKAARSKHEQELAALLHAVVLRGEGLESAGELLDKAVGPGVGLVLVSAEQSGRLDVAAIRLSHMMRTQASHHRAFVFSVWQMGFALTVASVVPSPLQGMAWLCVGLTGLVGGLILLEGRRGWGLAGRLWKLPFVGRLLQGQAIIRVCTVLELGIESGRSLTGLLGDCAAGEPNSAAAAACDRALGAIDSGSTLHEAITEHLGLESAEAAQLMQGERMGRVPQALHHIVEARIEQLGRTLRRTGVLLIVLPYILFVVPFVVLVFVFSFQ